MGKMWKGPSEAVKAARHSPIAVRLHRRAAEQFVFYSISDDGRSAKVWRLHRQGDNWIETALGEVKGGDPMNTFINVAHEHTAHDAELRELASRIIADRTETLLRDIRDAVSKVTGITDVLESAAAPIKSRYVGP